MAFKLRRVVIGHDENGKAIVTVDEIRDVQPTTFPTMAGTILWSTEGFPVSNDGNEDTSDVTLQGPALKGGTVFRIIEFGPGNPERMHRTDTIDYPLILEGEIDMAMDDGLWVLFQAGDVLVQRGTIHNWVNKGDKPCRIAFILIDAKPVEVASQALQATGSPGDHQ